MIFFFGSFQFNQNKKGQVLKSKNLLSRTGIFMLLTFISYSYSKTYWLGFDLVLGFV